MDPSLMRSWHHTAVVPFCKTLSFSLAQIQEIVLLSLMKWKQRDLSLNMFSDIQFSSVAQSCPNLCNPVNRSTPGFPVQHQLPEFTQTHIHRVSDAIQPSHPLSCPSPHAPTPSQHQSLFQGVSSLHEVAKVLEFQLQDENFQWTPRTDLH